MCIEEVRIKPSSAVVCDAYIADKLEHPKSCEHHRHQHHHHFEMHSVCWSLLVSRRMCKKHDRNTVGTKWCNCQLHARKCGIRAVRTLQVRMSPDMLTAYVLWSAHPECEDAAQHELQSRCAVCAFTPASRHRPAQCISRITDWLQQADCRLTHEGQRPCRLSKIRVSLGKALKARHVPKLEFRLNQLSEAQAAVEEELDRLRAQDT